MVPKVDEQPQSHVRRLQIVVDLSSVFVGQLGGSFDFHDDLVEADEVWFVRLRENLALVCKLQFRLGGERTPWSVSSISRHS